LRSILKMSEIAPNFARFWPLWGGSKFLDMHYKAQSNYDRVAKFHGDRLMELRDVTLNKKNVCGKT